MEECLSLLSLLCIRWIAISVMIIIIISDRSIAGVILYTCMYVFFLFPSNACSNGGLTSGLTESTMNTHNITLMFVAQKTKKNPHQPPQP